MPENRADRRRQDSRSWIQKPSSKREAGALWPETARIGARVVLALIQGYKLLVSPHFAGSCRFVPSCADYARDAVILHGACRGSWLALTRLVRCQPLCAGGHDPAPDK